MGAGDGEVTGKQMELKLFLCVQCAAKGVKLAERWWMCSDGVADRQRRWSLDSVACRCVCHVIRLVLGAGFHDSRPAAHLPALLVCSSAPVAPPVSSSIALGCPIHAPPHHCTR
jgi:hypothetical protein